MGLCLPVGQAVVTTDWSPNVCALSLIGVCEQSRVDERYIQTSHTYLLQGLCKPKRMKVIPCRGACVLDEKEKLLKYLPSHKNQVTMISCCKWNWLDSSSLPSLYGRFPGSLSVHFVLFMKLQVNGTQTCRVISSSVSSLGLNSSPDTMIGGPAEPPNKVSSGYLIRLRSLQSYSTPQAEISKSAGE